MKSQSVVISVAIWVGLLVTGLVIAAETGVVSATVTALSLSVVVEDAAVAYGSLALSASQDTQTLGDSQAATNTGNVQEDFNILSQNTASWTLASTIGGEQYTHEFGTDGGSTYFFMTTSYQELGPDIAVDNTRTFDLQITVPSSTSDFTQQNADVTVQAVAG